MLEEIRLLWSSSSTFVSSQRLPTSQKCCKLKKPAQIFLKQMVDIPFNHERSRSKSVEEIVLQVMHQSIPAAPIPPPPPGNCGAFARIVSPGGRALAYPRATPGLLTHVVSDSKSKRRRFYRKRPVVCH